MSYLFFGDVADLYAAIGGFQPSDLLCHCRVFCKQRVAAGVGAHEIEVQRLPVFADLWGDFFYYSCFCAVCYPPAYIVQAACVSIVLAVTNVFTSSVIEANENKKVQQALLQVMPDGGEFASIDVSGYSLPSTVKEAYRAQNGGYVFKLNTTGYASGMVIMCGISDQGKVVGTQLIASGETPSIGGVAADTVSKAIVGKDADTVNEVDTIAGATKTTAAYRSAVKDALNAALILGGAEVDIRTEEEILKDNLSAALPFADGEFEKYFLTEVISGVTDIYYANNQSGFVCVIGEEFVGLDKNGKVLSQTSEAVKSTAENAVSSLLSSETKALALSDYEGLSSRLVSAEKTLTGNYVLEINAEGYGIKGTIRPSGKYILIRVSLTSDGKIIDCMTVSQEETKGIGSVCAEESFYGQFDGKTEENYDKVDAISGATVTTNGYQTAIYEAFESVKIFEKGANS